MTDKPSYLHFDNSKYAWHPEIDYRAHPDEYRVGKGEQGVLICEPYKSEIGHTGVLKRKPLPEKAVRRFMSCF